MAPSPRSLLAFAAADWVTADVVVAFESTSWITIGPVVSNMRPTARYNRARFRFRRYPRTTRYATTSDKLAVRSRPMSTRTTTNGDPPIASVVVWRGAAERILSQPLEEVGEPVGGVFRTVHDLDLECAVDQFDFDSFEPCRIGIVVMAVPVEVELFGE